MSDTKEMQDEEREALVSIYEGDELFKQTDAQTFTYKYGETDSLKSFQLEISWPPNYPNELPTVNMNSFYNRNLPVEVKEKIQSILLEEGEQWLGCGMTYTLFECLKDKVDDILDSVTAVPVSVDVATESVDKMNLNQGSAASKEPKKEQMTKAQKRRMWDKVDHTGEKPRGWNWIDIVKHLSQTGRAADEPLSQTVTAST